jgi:hypothetical protein
MDPAVALAERFNLINDEWLRTGTVTKLVGGGLVKVDLAGGELTVPHLDSYDPTVGDAVQVLVAPGVKLVLGMPGVYAGSGEGGGAGPHTHPEGDIVDLIADLAGKQTSDTDLSAIAALAPANDDVIQRKAGAWTNRTMAQLAADLGGGAPSGPAGGSLSGTYPNPTIAAGAVGSSEVAAAIKDPATGTAGLRTLGVGSVQAAAGDHAHSGTYQPLDADLTAIGGLTPTNDDVIQRKSGAWINRTLAQLRTDIGADAAAGTASLRTLGTGAVQAAAGDHTHAAGGLDQDLVDIAALTPANDDVIQRKGGVWVNRTMVQLAADLGVGGGGNPTGPAGGSLAGSYPNPTIAAGVVTGTEIAAAIKDPVAGTAGLRTLGTGSAQAAAGDHAHAAYQAADADLTTIAGLTPTTNNVIQSVSSAWASRTPTQLLATLPADQAVGTASPRTLGVGSTQAAAGDHLHAAAYQPLDSDLTTIAGLSATTDNVLQSTASAWASRTPTQHQATHPADQAAGTASVRTLGTGATQAAAGNHAHTSIVARSRRTTSTAGHTGTNLAGSQKVTELSVSVLSGLAYRINVSVPLWINGGTQYGTMQATLLYTTDGTTPGVGSTQMYQKSVVCPPGGIIGEVNFDVIYVPGSNHTLKLLLTNHAISGSTGAGTNWSTYGATTWPCEITVENLGTDPGATGTHF